MRKDRLSIELSSLERRDSASVIVRSVSYREAPSRLIGPYGIHEDVSIVQSFFESGIGARDIIETGNWVREFELRQKWLFFMNGEAI